MFQDFSPAAERNKAPILAALEPLLEHAHEVLEIGAGSGQHACHFAAALPWLRWQASEHPTGVATLAANLAGADIALPAPLALDVRLKSWPVTEVDAVYAANVVHCMTWPAVEALFAGVAQVLRAGGPLLLYGPFNRDGRFTSEGNLRLDAWARGLDPDFGLRDLAELEALAARVGMALCENLALPANNQLLVWRHASTQKTGR